MAWKICACEIFLTAFSEGLRISRKNGQEKIDFAALFLSFLILLCPFRRPWAKPVIVRRNERFVTPLSLAAQRGCFVVAFMGGQS
jgi:hypothetical protein